LVCAPTGNDAALSVDFITRAGLHGVACARLDELCVEMKAGCGALLLAEEVLGQPSIHRLVEALENQEPWSDVPVALITTSGNANEERLRQLALFRSKGNVMLLERPFRPSTLISTLEVALRARSRQYQVRKLLEEVQERESRFRRMSDATPVLISMTDVRKNVTWVNRAWLRFTGRTMDEEIRAGRLESVFPEDRASYAATLQANFETREPSEVVYRLRRHDGQWRWMLDRGTPLLESSGEFIGYISTCIDITDIQQAQLLLGHHARRSGLVSQFAAELLLTNSDPQAVLPTIFQRLADELGASFYLNYLFDRAGQSLHLESSIGLDAAEAEKLTGAKLQERLQAEPVAKESRPLIGPGSPLESVTQRYLRSRGARAVAGQPLQVARQSFGMVIFAAVNRDQFSREEMRFIATVADLVAATLERNRLLADLREARDAAEKASGAKDDFLAALSHELRTPLNPVLLVATAAAANPELPAEVRADFDQIAKGVTLEARLIDDLLDITRITRGKTSLDLRWVDAHAVFRDALVTTQPDLDQKKITISLALRAPRSHVTGDAVRLQQVFWNVLKNAAKFSPVGSTISITSGTEMRRGQFVLAVKDSGVGMTIDELKRVFQAFSQGDHARAGGSHRFGGLGLGLAISKMLIELHGGSIEATSPGRELGSTFVIRLPLASVDARAGTELPEKTGDGANGNLVGTPASRSGRLLLVEDHEPTRTSLAVLLKRRGFEVETAGSVAEAQALAAETSFDLLLSDIGLPDGNGYELMASLKSQASLKGIALSGYGMDGDIEESRRAGFRAHLIKPVNIQALDAALARVNVPEK
jgi:PAS domain S-box-containing protein